MDIPTDETRSDGPVLEDIRALERSASSVSAYGRAKGLDQLESFSGLARLWLSGIADRDLARIGRLPTLRELVIHDYRASSLAALPELPALESLAVCGSPKLKALAGLERYPGLRRLILFDCCNYQDLSPLESLVLLQTLCLEGGFSKMLRVASLQSLSGLRALQRLRLASIRVGDGSLRPLEGLERLDGPCASAGAR